MRKVIIHILILGIVLGIGAGCDRGFDELNVNPTAPTSLDPAFVMNNAVLRSSFPGQTLPYELAIVQQIVSPNGGVLAGGNYNQDNRSVTLGNWQRYYREVVKSAVDVLNQTRDNADRSNLYNTARIIRAHAFMILTDTYGDVPYSEAGLGYLEDVRYPKYEPQQVIYADILKELDEASAALDAAKTREASDILYGGDVVKWKRFGYSLLLRAAMRLVKVDPGTAQTYVAKAVAGGVMESNADNAIIRHTALYVNEVVNALSSTEANNYYLAAPFVNYLKANKDPRLTSFAVRYVGAASGTQQVAARASRDTTVQIGMPMGYNNNSIVAEVQRLGLASYYDFSQLDRTRMGSPFGPVYLVTYAQTQLLLAEAAVRKWAQGEPATHYTNGIRAHMTQLADYGETTAVPSPAIDQYVQTHPLEAGKELEQINTQYWVASFLNGPEAFANFRRSGFPALAPNPYPGKDIRGQFIRRLTYPDAEKSVNAGNIQEAIGRQGEDNLETPVWWDKQ